MASSFIDGTMLEMTYEEIKAHAENDTYVLFPIGVVEEHGPHMSVSVDILLPYKTALEGQKIFEKNGMNSIIAPPFYWGVNGTTKSFPGSFCVSKETFIAMLVDIFLSLKSWGFKNIIAIPGHGETDHLLGIRDALKTVYDKTGPGALMFLTTFVAEKSNIDANDYVTLFDIPGDPMASEPYLDVHAGATETSVMLKYFPDHVRKEIWKTLQPTQLTTEDYAEWEKGEELFDKISPQGYAGDPAAGSAEMGEAIYEFALKPSLEEFIQKSDQFTAKKEKDDN